jgi:Ca2+-binding EF-hand superfamily protein
LVDPRFKALREVDGYRKTACRQVASEQQQSTSPKGYEKMGIKITQGFDVNQDGKLTQEEAKGCMPRIYDHFSMIDSNNQGYVTVAQIQAVANR